MQPTSEGGLTLAEISSSVSQRPTSARSAYALQCLRQSIFSLASRQKGLMFLTNHHLLPPLTICVLYHRRWEIELFFKWVKQNLRIKRFYGTSENAVKSQIWIAIAVYVLVAIIKKELDWKASLHTLLQTLSVTLFEKMSLQQALSEIEEDPMHVASPNQLTLFDS